MNIEYFDVEGSYSKLTVSYDGSVRIKFQKGLSTVQKLSIDIWFTRIAEDIIEQGLNDRSLRGRVNYVDRVAKYGDDIKISMYRNTGTKNSTKFVKTYSKLDNIDL